MKWPFFRSRSKRSSPLTTASTDTEPVDGPGGPLHHAGPRLPTQIPDTSSLRKRRRSSELLDKDPPPERRHHRSRYSLEDITALPGAQRLERSPHLRRSEVFRTAIPYDSGAAVSASRLAAMRDLVHNDGKEFALAGQKRRLSKRQSAHVKAVREEEVRAMSKPVPIPKRYSSQGDVLAREHKKARRLTAKSVDTRASTVSLPFQASIHSSMSGATDPNAWEIQGSSLLSPRPSVRLGSLLRSPSQPTRTVARTASNKEKMPALIEKEEVGKKDRRKVAELADELDASDLRTILQRDSRRREKKQLSDKEKLEARLRRRLEKEARRRALDPIPLIPPTAVHPAFRDQTPEQHPSDLAHVLLTPTSDRPNRFENGSLTEPHHDNHDGSFGSDPIRDSSPSSTYSDPYKLGPPREDTPHAALLTPPAEPTREDPILGMAHEVRYPPGRLERISSSLPSPAHEAPPRDVSPPREASIPVRPSLSTSPSMSQLSTSKTRKPGMTWGSIFRRGINRSASLDHAAPSAPKSSFSNTSRDSMLRQNSNSPHPYQMANSTRRSSATPVRTQSIFREHLPESSPASPHESKPDSDIISAAKFAAARRSRRAEAADLAHDRDQLNENRLVLDRNEDRSRSPHISDGRGSAAALSISLASIDSEGSWLTGRPAKRKSNASHIRNSAGSAMRRDVDNHSYDELAVPDGDLVRRLTPSLEDQADYLHQTDDVLDRLPEEADGSLLRRNTSRRKPRLVLGREAARSKEALVAGVSPVRGSPVSPTASASSEFDQVRDPDWDDKQNVVYGRGHARQISTGSAKLLDIRSRSGRSTPDARASIHSASALHSPALHSPTVPPPASK